MSHAGSPHHTSAPAALELVVFIKRERWSYSLPPSGVVNIGRSSSNEIRIEHRSVSRQHIRLYVGERIELEDIGSANGTWLFPTAGAGSVVPEETLHSGEAHRVQPGTRVQLQVGDMVRIGLALLSIQRRLPSSRAPRRSDDGPRSGNPPVLADPNMRELYQLAAKVAQSPISVLILGETGVGKDVLAEVLHSRSPRASGPFLRLNCAALAENLLESELFGYQRGAFTGANEAKQGLLEAAHKGTAFLDEVGELPLTTQVKLLHVLETGEVLRVGATKPRQVDVRFIAATNRDLTEEVRQGRFRKDLYFRINAVNFTVPPLRERKSEIIPLARYFLANFCGASGLPEPELSEHAIERMLTYSWPGNVRELRNSMERAPILCGDGPILPEHVVESRLSLPTTLFDAADDFDASDLWTATTTVGPITVDHPLNTGDDRIRLLQALEACGGNQTRAAKILGISRRTLVNRLNEYGLPRPRKKE
jgi:DNA-binding NtrC family response regulator